MDNNDNENEFAPVFDLIDSDVEFGKCPMCKIETFELEHVDAALKKSLEDSKVEKIYDSVCKNCFATLNTKMSLSAKLEAERQQRLETLLKKWTTKINILKTGRSLMSQKIYSEAEKYYEEYIKVLEAVYNNGEDGIEPEMIPQDHRRQEATLLCSLYCDLIYIYDQYHTGTAKLKHAGDSLTQFLPYSRGQGATLRKLRKDIDKAKNKPIYENITARVKNKKNGCFIATAVFDDQEAVELTVLRNFRDQFLKKYTFGRKLIYLYYRNSPKLIPGIKKVKSLKLILRKLLSIFSLIVDRIL